VCVPTACDAVPGASDVCREPGIRGPPVTTGMAMAMALIAASSDAVGDRGGGSAHSAPAGARVWGMPAVRPMRVGDGEN
jgi:hypothetical protein